MTQTNYTQIRKLVMQTKRFLILAGLLKTDYNATVSEKEGKIPSISGLATNSALTAVENK